MPQRPVTYCRFSRCEKKHNNMKILLAIDSFKNCMISAEAEEAVAGAFAEVLPDAQIVAVPVSDGGEGMARAFTSALGGRLVPVTVHDALMRRREAVYGIAPDGCVIVEVAEACGLTHIAAEERDPVRATTYGVGEIVAHAVRGGCRDFIIGLGGTATSDCGAGMLRALVDLLGEGGNIDRVIDGPMRGCRFTLACDVRNPLTGADGAAAVFAPQKGASPDAVRQLEERAVRFARFSARHFGRDCSRQPGAGAAGGLGYAFMQYFGAKQKPGADLLFDLLHFGHLAADADIVVTGEGSADRQTLMGKLPERVMACTRANGNAAVWLVAGRVTDGERLAEAGFSAVGEATPLSQPLCEALRPEVAKANLRLAVLKMAKESTGDSVVSKKT